jgi:Xaa-Pro aminopeptidase
MASKGIQAYIVPKNDEYMSSYIPKDKDRLYKLTNFTGSNGLAIVFQSQ